MTYIITVDRHLNDPTAEFLPGAAPAVEIVEVETLSDVKRSVSHLIATYDAKATPAPDADLDDYSRSYFSACADLETMESDGGIIGPLPDGMVIHVRHGA